MRATCPAYPFLLDFITLIVWWSVKVIKLPIKQSSPASRHLNPLRSKYSHQHPVLKHPQFIFFSWCETLRLGADEKIILKWISYNWMWGSLKFNWLCIVCSGLLWTWQWTFCLLYRRWISVTG
jgi:hypothetical protein